MCACVGLQAIVHGAGSLSIKMLRRTANLEATANTTSIPSEQDTPLAMPKKTKLYLEHAQRERELASSIHQNFQKDLCRLRLETARAYLKTLTSADMVSIRHCGLSGARCPVVVVGIFLATLLGKRREFVQCAATLVGGRT